ncbi:nuclear transport factor 2 family protein [Streptomyces sp. NRRL F-5123]|uniref:nuclear transport factor 2 family protein n=1 Tax=Streptomyces sp. NRRL F-5123 TaxID=1463856 RepID=UPI0004E16DC5|nr:nuclear transport factor 2 family protein [Streptomyces sp. NRRL F-5123]
MTSRPLPGSPASDPAAFVVRFSREMALSEEDPAAVVDRYHSPDVVQCNDGAEMTRDMLVAHAGPVRRNVLDVRVDVQDSVVDPDGAAVRYTLRAEMRRGPVIVTEVYAFVRFAPDGRVRRIDQITRDLPPPGGADAS